ncbi:hypothetical protein [Streptomyces sp. NPDC057677]|uniref:hypothetical protein n=1 Tax=unclassified Streptomyces TaxID=2593676 RepID=UPI0036C77B49
MEEKTSARRPAEVARDDFDRALGAMVREAAFMDMLMISLCQHLVASPHGSLLVHGEPTSRVQSMIKKLLDARKEIAPEHKNALRLIVEESGPLFNKRNEYVHGAAIFGESGELTLLRTRRLNAEIIRTPATITELQKLGDDLAALSLRMGDAFASFLIDDLGLPNEPFTEDDDA